MISRRHTESFVMVTRIFLFRWYFCSVLISLGPITLFAGDIRTRYFVHVKNTKTLRFTGYQKGGGKGQKARTKALYTSRPLPYVSLSLHAPVGDPFSG